MLMRLLEILARRLGDEHGGVTVTVQEGVPPVRLSRQQVGSVVAAEGRLQPFGRRTAVRLL